MSGNDDNLLARWSRRKQAAQRQEPSPPCGERVAPKELDEGYSGEEPGAGDPSPNPSPQGEEEPPEPLPRIEDLTADSDISPFLRAGVPEALKTAALRRAWSLDPAIRDYVGPAEYAHDFNNPATVPGFGSGPAWDPSTAAEFARKIVNRAGEADSGQTVSNPREPAAEPELHAVRLDAYPDPSPEHRDRASSAEMPDPATSSKEPLHADERPAHEVASVTPARHGGAMPR